MTPNCWCGNTNLTNFSKEYFLCRKCETLVAKNFPQTKISRVCDDEKDFYGKEYWLSHQTEGLGLQSIETRSRTDLLDRCGHWLKTLLKFRLSPCTLLDIGCSHGGFVALADLAGYTSTGLELSPWVVDYGHKAFKARILLGPVEDQNFTADAFDVVTLFDVLEHLQEPRITIKECVRVLSAEGIVIIQTPCLPAEATFKILQGSQDPFLKMMLPDEHLFLFSQRGVVRLLEECGLNFVKFEKAPFGDYDMLVIASRSELKSFEDKERWETLRVSATGRLLDAYISQDAIIRGLNERLIRALRDATERLENVTKLGVLLKESQEELKKSQKELKESQEELKESQKELREFQNELRESQKDRADLYHRLETVSLPVQRKYERIPAFIKEICLRIWK